MTKNFPLSNNIKKISNIFSQNGYELYVVGGAVRDFLLGRKINDIDFCTSATPDEMLKLFPHSIKTGLKHGTLTIPFGGEYFEVTTFRIEGEYKDSRHPENVRWTTNLKADLSRRDFTINAMAASAKKGEIVDPFDGLGDLKKKVIRTVGDAHHRFSEDALRIMRGLRFATTLNFSLDSEASCEIIELKETLKNISAERIQAELFKMLSSPYAIRGAMLLKEFAIIDYIFKINESCYSPLSNACINSFDINTKLAILLYNLDYLDIRKVLNKLRCSNNIIDSVSKSVRLTKEIINKEQTQKLNDTDLRCFTLDCGEYYNIVRELLVCHNAPQTLINSLTQIKGSEIPLKSLAVNGNDCIALGLKGANISSTLKDCLKFVQSDPQKLNNKQALLDYIKTRLN